MKTIIALVFVLIAVGCGNSSTGQKATGIPNPASVKCIQDGYKLEIRTSPDGGQYGVCINQNGDECEEWAYFRGECSFPQ